MSYKQIDTAAKTELMEAHQIGSLLAKVLFSMHYSEKDIASFFAPCDHYEFNEEVYEPIRKKLLEIADKGQKVFIFGDYDCDGICATSIMMMIMQKLGIEAGYYIPSRINEGYGLNVEKLALAHQKGYEVLVTVDNGVSAAEGLKWAREHDMFTIVTDHHQITEKPDCDMLLHPDLMGEEYRYLSGGAVAYMLARYLQVNDEKMEILAMLSLIGDVMSLKGINVKIVRDGLSLLNSHLYPQVEMLAPTEGRYSESDVSFKVVPMINSAGRVSEQPVSQANQLVRYFITDDRSLMFGLSQLISELNDERKTLSNQQSEMLKGKIDPNDTINFLYDPDLHIGILGLIASRIAAETNKVTFVLTDNGDNIVGSGRGVGEIDLMDLLSDFACRTVNLGGHTKACGITVRKEDLEDLSVYLHEKCDGLSTDSVYEYIDVDLDELNLRDIQQLYRYRPYGQDRTLPLMKITIPNNSLITMRNDHQLKWKCGDLDFVSFENEGYEAYRNREYVTVYGNLQENRFRGRISYQIMVREIV
ncbi:MAG: DHH family phosphoesterase [Erysipelotrichaceae bacterium]|nr:DHH family phosphoesterase [Erysipelotrichaceae bacterium]